MLLSRVFPSARLASPQLACVRRFSESAAPGGALVLAEHDGKQVSNSTLAAISAAGQLAANNVVLLVTGHQTGDVVHSAALIPGVSRVVFVNHECLAHQFPENLVPVIQHLHDFYKFSHIVGAHTSTGKNTLPRLAAKLDVQPVSDVVAIKSTDTFVRPIYAGNALATVRSTDAVKVLTVRPTAFDKPARRGNDANVEPAPTESNVPADSGKVKFVAQEVVASERPQLDAARIVVSGGRALGSAENFKILEMLCEKLGAALGASRAAVDAGYVNNELQVGQTGKVVAPELYIAVGISGAIQHLAGMKDSKTIVAINKDPEAPIFQIADYGLVADLFQAVPELTTKVAKQ